MRTHLEKNYCDIVSLNRYAKVVFYFVFEQTNIIIFIFFYILTFPSQMESYQAISHFKAILDTLHDLDVITKDTPRNTEFEQINFFYYA